MIKGIGCDIADILRFEKNFGNIKFNSKVYTDNEQLYIKNKNAHTAAGIWCAKEAVSKALGTGFTEFDVKDVEILHTSDGKPYVKLYKEAENIFEKLGGNQILLSI